MINIFKRKEKVYPEPPPAPYPYEELKEKCPVCHVNLKAKGKAHGSAFLGLKNGMTTWSCANCLTWEGRQVIQEGYTDWGGFLSLSSDIPPVYGDKVISFRKTS